MHWNYRVMLDNEANTMSFVEAFYKDGAVDPDSYSEPFLQADSLEELGALVNRLKLALEKPTLNSRDF